MDELSCECGSKYFVETVVSKYKEGNIGPTTGLRSMLADPWKVYMCINQKCKKIHVPELTSFSISRTDMRAYQEILAAERGEPIDIPIEPKRAPGPGEILPR